MLFCIENLKFALRLIWKNFSIYFYIENKEIFLTTLYGKPKTHKKVIFKALLRLSYYMCSEYYKSIQQCYIKNQKNYLLR